MDQVLGPPDHLGPAWTLGLLQKMTKESEKKRDKVSTGRSVKAPKFTLKLLCFFLKLRSCIPSMHAFPLFSLPFLSFT
jgi:hypothetical protein